MPVVHDPDRATGRPAAVVLHGAGSTAEFVRRAFGPALSAAGFRLVSYELGRARPAVHGSDLAQVVADTGARLVGGISLGAHIAARWAAQEPADLDGLLLALPAWTGRAAGVAGLSGYAAAEVERDGLPATLARLATRTAGPGGWVAHELRAAWPSYGEKALVAALREAATTPGPTASALTAIACPVGLVGLRGDAFHPEEVAHEWARLLPAAALTILPLRAPAADRSRLGAAALVAWRRAVSGSR